MQSLLTAVAAICGIVSLVCWILVLIEIFKRSVGLGILGILCGVFAFIYGWVKVTEYQIKNVMMAWTVALAISIVVQGFSAASVMSQIPGNLNG